MRLPHPTLALILPLAMAASLAGAACASRRSSSDPGASTASASTWADPTRSALPIATPKPSSKLTSKPTPEPASKPAPAAKMSAWQQRAQEQDRALVAGLKGQLLQISLPASPLVRNRRLTSFVYLPPGYDDAANATRLYSVAYLLHGAPGGVRDCFVNARAHRVAEKMILGGRISPMILVGWEAGGPGGLSDPVYYLNREDGYRMEDFVLQVLVPWVDARFRTQPRPESRALIGFSAGGFGAANLGLKHPEVWRVLASHAGFFNPADDIQEMSRILGPRDSHSAAWQANDPIAEARRIPNGTRLHFYMDVGREDSLLGEFRQMERELKVRGVDFEAHVFKGAHTWEYLERHYEDSLAFADSRWKEMAAQNRQALEGAPR